MDELFFEYLKATGPRPPILLGPATTLRVRANSIQFISYGYISTWFTNRFYTRNVQNPLSLKVRELERPVLT